jgi:hypothetical protein
MALSNKENYETRKFCMLAIGMIDENELIPLYVSYLKGFSPLIGLTLKNDKNVDANWEKYMAITVYRHIMESNPKLKEKMDEELIKLLAKPATKNTAKVLLEEKRRNNW